LRTRLGFAEGVGFAGFAGRISSIEPEGLAWRRAGAEGFVESICGLLMGTCGTIKKNCEKKKHEF
jgi:hypothetical protein